MQLTNRRCLSYSSKGFLEIYKLMRENYILHTQTNILKISHSVHNVVYAEAMDGFSEAASKGPLHIIVIIYC